MIYITGCAKSGTTLLRRMFFAFEKCSIIDNEIDINAFVEMARNQGDNTLVGKRVVSTVLSNTIFPALFNDQLNVIRNNGVRIVNIIRDGRDAVLNGWISCDRWISSLEQAEQYKADIAATVYFEDLIRKPDEVQQYLAGMFGLTLHANFSDYPAFIQEDDAAVGYYKKYQLSKDKIGQALDYYKKLCPGLQNKFDELLERHGYL